jgi:hypothetical protein
MDTPTLIGTGFALLGLVVWLLCAYMAYQAAPQRGRRAGVWGVLGVFFGPFALFALYLMPAMKPVHHGAARHDQQADLYEVPHKKKG